MKYKYELTPELIEKAVRCGEFAHGGMQVTIKLKDGRVFGKAVISNSSAIIAMRGYKELPFSVKDIEDIYQTEEDVSPVERSGWEFWDEWKIRTS